MGAVESYLRCVDPRLSDIDVVAPKASIIITNYNYSRYIRQCLESVAVQDYPAVECVVVDDGSQDESVRKIRNFIDGTRSSVSFKLVVHETTQGQLAGFRTGFEHSGGSFVAFLDADDLLLPNFVTEHVQVHLSRSPVAFTSSNQYQIDEVGQVIGGVHPDLRTRDDYRAAYTVSLRKPFWIWATTSSMMFRRAVLTYVLSNADEAFKKCADNYVCHFCNLLGGSILIPKRLGCYRRHQQNTFSNNPLIGGHLPTGDMRNHPAHDEVLRHILARLLEMRQEFIALLGIDGYLHTLVRVAPRRDLWRMGIARRDQTFENRHFPRVLQYWLWVRLRTLVRRFKNRPAYASIIDLDITDEKTKQPRHQHHCGHAE